MEGTKVNWDAAVSGGFISLEEGVPKTLVLKNWKMQTVFKYEKDEPEKNIVKGTVRPGVTFEVWKDDNATFDESSKKTWTVTAKRALALLRPICEKAEAQGKLEIKVLVVAVGNGTAKTFSIKEIA